MMRRDRSSRATARRRTPEGEAGPSIGFFVLAFLGVFAIVGSIFATIAVVTKAAGWW